MFQPIYVLICMQFLCIAQAFSGGYAPLHTYHNADEDTSIAIKRALHDARGTTYSINQTALTKSWADATLYSVTASSSTNSSDRSHHATLELEAGLTVICTACYINGSVSGFLSVEKGFNITEAIDGVKDEVVNVTKATLDKLEDFALNASKSVIEFKGVPAWPTVQTDFDLDDASGFPGVHAQFEFNDLELYLELEVQLSAGATYTLNLFTTESPVGFSVPGLEAGALFKVSLVLIAQAEIDISSGIHIKLDDGLVLGLELFNKNVSGITLPGGRMEFLPITIEGHGSLQALLQIEASVGFDVSSPDFGVFKVTTGIGAQVFAYVADFLLQVDASTSDDADCAFEAVAEYTLALGAAAGATIAVDTYQWGPAPSTTVPVFYTTLASICVGTKTSPSTITPTATLKQRDRNLVTTTVSTLTTYTLVNCPSTGLINCPAPLQSTTSIEKVMTTVLTVESGVEATFPANTFTSVKSAIPFGENVRTLGATSGTPVSYIPPPITPSPTSNSKTGGDHDTVKSTDDEHHSNNNKLIIGLSVGLGVPAVIVLAFSLWWFFYQRRKYTLVPQPEATVYSPALDRGAEAPQTTVATT